MDSYTELPEWAANKKILIRPKYNDEQCFKRTVIASLHHKEIKRHLERISLLQRYED